MYLVLYLFFKLYSVFISFMCGMYVYIYVCVPHVCSCTKYGFFLLPRGVCGFDLDQARQQEPLLTESLSTGLSP